MRFYGATAVLYSKLPQPIERLTNPLGEPFPTEPEHMQHSTVFYLGDDESEGELVDLHLPAFKPAGDFLMGEVYAVLQFPVSQRISLKVAPLPVPDPTHSHPARTYFAESPGATLLSSVGFEFQTISPCA